MQVLDTACFARKHARKPSERQRLDDMHDKPHDCVVGVIIHQGEDCGGVGRWNIPQTDFELTKCMYILSASVVVQYIYRLFPARLLRYTLVL